MPLRVTPLITNQFYHIFNRGINKQPIFFGRGDNSRMIRILEFYSFSETRLRFSKFLLLSKDERLSFMKKLREVNNRLIDIISYCLMPNHFHFLLKQNQENGISKFMANLQNSYTRYFNTRYKKIGPILQGQFKAVRIEDNEQLIHLTRYIHLNPYSSFVVRKLSDLESYPWSSFLEYIGTSSNVLCSKDIILANFKNLMDYKKFVLDQAEYQRSLEEIKHLAHE